MSLEEHIQKAFPYTPTSDQQTAIIGFSSFLRQSKKIHYFCSRVMPELEKQR
jgi:transcription-repair coupling factor (superfamily II helicase)